MSATYIADLKKRLAKFSADFGERQIAGITVEELDNWLRNLDRNWHCLCPVLGSVVLLFPESPC